MCANFPTKKRLIHNDVYGKMLLVLAKVFYSIYVVHEYVLFFILAMSTMVFCTQFIIVWLVTKVASIKASALIMYVIGPGIKKYL